EQLQNQLYSARLLVFFFSSRRRHTRFSRDWSSDVCSSDLFARSSPPELSRAKRRNRLRFARSIRSLPGSQIGFSLKACSPCARALPSAPRAPAYCFTDALKRKRRHDAGASMHVFRLRVNAMARTGGDPARKNAGNLRRSRNRWLVRHDPLSNQQILFLLARLERVVEPAWALAAAAPGGTIRR